MIHLTELDKHPATLSIIISAPVYADILNRLIILVYWRCDPQLNLIFPVTALFSKGLCD